MNKFTPVILSTVSASTDTSPTSSGLISSTTSSYQSKLPSVLNKLPLNTSATGNKLQSSVTSILTKNHIDHLEANSVSVIPIDTVQSVVKQPVNNLVNMIRPSSGVGNQPQTTAVSIIASQTPVIQMKNLSHILESQRLETANVLMDISKQVVITSPASRSPQSPMDPHQLQQKNQSHQRQSTVHGRRQQSINSSVINLKRSPSRNEEMDLSMKRTKTDGMHRITPADLSALSLLANRDLIEVNDDNSQNSDTSSEPGRLHVDMSPQQNRGRMKIHDSDRESPESNKSDEHATDPATTQLWQALARTSKLQITKDIIN